MVIESENRLLEMRARRVMELEEGDNGSSANNRSSSNSNANSYNNVSGSLTRGNENSTPLIAPRPRFAIRFLNAPEGEGEVRQGR